MRRFQVKFGAQLGFSQSVSLLSNDFSRRYRCRLTGDADGYRERNLVSRHFYLTRYASLLANLSASWSSQEPPLILWSYVIATMND